MRGRSDENGENFAPSLLSVPGDLEVVSIIQALHVAGPNKANLGVRRKVGGEIKGLGDLAGVAAIHVIGLKGRPRCSAIV